MKRIAVVASVVGLFLVGACGPGSVESAPAGTEVSVDSGEDSGDAAGGQVASVERYAGEIAVLKESVEDWQEGWQEDSCTLLSHDDIYCEMHLMTGSLTAQTVDITLGYLPKQDAPGYIGDVPDELSALYAETQEYGQAAGDAAASFDELECPEDEGCSEATVALVRSIDNLSRQFIKWSPYLGPSS